MYVKWTLAPSGFYIGVVEFNNKHYYASGRTTDLLEKNMKRSLYIAERVSATQVHLEHSKSESLDLQYASRVFMSKFVKSKKGAQPAVVNKTIVTPPKPQVEYVCEQHGDEMVVFEMKEVARYKVHKPVLALYPERHFDPCVMTNTGDDNGENDD